MKKSVKDTIRTVLAYIALVVLAWMILSVIGLAVDYLINKPASNLNFFQCFINLCDFATGR